MSHIPDIFRHISNLNNTKISYLKSSGTFLFIQISFGTRLFELGEYIHITMDCSSGSNSVTKYVCVPGGFSMTLLSWPCYVCTSTRSTSAQVIVFLLQNISMFLYGFPMPLLYWSSLVWTPTIIIILEDPSKICGSIHGFPRGTPNVLLKFHFKKKHQLVRYLCKYHHC